MFDFFDNLRTSRRGFVFGVLAMFSLLTACGGGGGDDGSDIPVRTTNYRVDFAPEMVIGATAVSNTITATANISSQQGDGNYAAGNVTVSGISATAVTINEGYAGENGPVVVTLNNAGGGTWNVPVTEVDFDDLYRLEAAGFYISIQTPQGELRGQIVPQDWVVSIIEFDADSVVPASTSTGSAKAGLSFNPSTGTYRIRITVSGVSDVIAAAIHNAIAGARGDAVINLEQSATNPNVWGSRDINNINADDRFSLSGLNLLASGALYFSIESASNMGGDLRGQIVDDTIVIFNIELSTAQVVGSSVVSDAIGVATVTWTETLSRFGVAVNTDITNALGVYVHQGAPGTDGPVLFTLTPDPMLPGNWVLAPTDLDANATTTFLNDNFYITIQTAAYPGGELRGQLDRSISPEATVALIGPDGGELSTPDGVTLSVPPGALAETRLISARRLTSTAALPALLADPFVPLHAAVEFGPDGLEFASPVTLTVTLDKVATPGASQPVLLFDPQTNGWEETEFIATVDASGETATVELVHFSDYVITFNGKDSAGYFGKIDPFQTPEVLFKKVQNRFYGLLLSGLPSPFSPGSVPIDDPNFGVDLFNCYAPRAARYTLYHNRAEMPIDEYIGDPSGATFAIQFSREFDETIITGDISFQTVFTFDVKVFFFATSPTVEVSASPAELWVNGQSDVSVKVRCGEDGFRDQDVTLTLDNNSIGLISANEGTTDKDGIFMATFSADAEQGGTGTLTAETEWSAPLEGVPLKYKDEIGIEVFSLTGNWSGSGTETISLCQDPLDNGTFGASASFPIFQSDFGISGSAFWTSFSGTVIPQPDGTFSLSGSYTDTEDGNSVGQFNGSGSAKTGVLNLSWSGSDLDDTCVFTGSGTATRQ
jgi:hypothetical protein